MTCSDLTTPQSSNFFFSLAFLFRHSQRGPSLELHIRQPGESDDLELFQRIHVFPRHRERAGKIPGSVCSLSCHTAHL